MKWIIPFAVLAAPAFADPCPAPVDQSVQLDRIVTEISQSRDQRAARALTQKLWAIWLDAPDAAAQALLDKGMVQSESLDLLGARDTFDALITYCPDYAEGYNQRAYANFLRRDYQAALVDLDAALVMMPNHIAALSGKALTLIGMGRAAEGQEALRGALALNPWLAERALIDEPDGTDI